MSHDQRLARRVGAIGLVVLGLAIVFFVFIFDQIEWGKQVRVRVYFHATGGLTEGAPFVVAGHEVGHVETIALSPKGAKGPLEGEEGIAVTVALEASWARRITRGGDVFITSRGALSGKYLEIAPAATPGPTLREGDELLGRDPPSLDRVLQRTWDNLTTAARFAAEIRPAMNDLSASVDELKATMQQIAPDVAFRDDVDALIAEARKSYDALGGRPGLDRIGEVRDHTGTVVDQARTTIGKLRESAELLGASLDALKGRLGTKGSEAIDHVQLAIDRVKATIDKIDPLLAQAQELQAALERGDGSLMKLMHDPEFPEDAKELGKILKRQPWKLIDRPVK